MVVKRLPKREDPQIRRLYNRGIKSVIPLFHGKSPAYEGWQKISDAEAQGKIWSWKEENPERQVNYGIRLGPQWGDIVDIDLDSSEARQLAEHYLPETAKFGRGGVCTHFLYKQLGTKAEKFPSKRYQWDKRDEKSVLLEFRASGQTMGPGSVHPVTGEEIEWFNSEEIREVESADLIRAVNNLAAASLLLRDWQCGGRDELATCLVGSMVRGDWDDHDIDAFLEPILMAAGDEESIKRMKAERLRNQLENDGRVPGLRRLREVCTGGGLGQAGFEKIVEWLELGGGDVLEEINHEFAVVSLPMGGVSIMREHGPEGVTFLDQASFKLIYSNRMVQHRGREVTADRFWLGHRDRREYLKGVVFRPGREVAEGEYNLWKGFAVEPVEGTFGMGWELLLGHIQNSLCHGEERLWRWFIGWMAHRVQRPWEVPQSAIVLIGERGDGKSTVFKLLGQLFGKHYMAVTNPRHFLGNFNKHFMDKVLVLADEACWGGDKTNEGVLKVMISEEKRVIEIKGKDSFEIDNCTGYGICSNNDWVVPVGRHERRFLILRGQGERRGDLAFWDRLYNQMQEEGGLGRMLYDLQNWDLGSGADRWRGNQPPVTDELQLQALRGVEHWVQWIWQESEQWIDGQEHEEWQDELYDRYCAWMDRHRYRVDSEAIWSKCLERMFGSAMSRVRRKYIARQFSGRAGVSSEYKKKYRLLFDKRWRERLNDFVGNS